MSKRKKDDPIARSAAEKILLIAAEICARHGSVIGDQVSQDWHGDTSLIDDLTIEEKNKIMFLFEQSNSNGEEYEEGYFPMDEMVISFAIGDMLKRMAEEIQVHAR